MEEKTDLNLMYIDVKEKKSSAMFVWYGQELRIECKHLKISNIDSGEEVRTDNNYKLFFEHCYLVLKELLRVLDVDLYEAWNIFYNQETFAKIDGWECWENVESIKDLDLIVNKYDASKQRLEEFLYSN